MWAMGMAAGGPASWAQPESTVPISIYSNISKCLELKWSKENFPELKNFQIKYGFIGN
jgi:hypothetical protein